MHQRNIIELDGNKTAKINNKNNHTSHEGSIILYTISKDFESQEKLKTAEPSKKFHAKSNTMIFKNKNR